MRRPESIGMKLDGEVSGVVCGFPDASGVTPRGLDL
jgi:hypothetical protein